MMSAQQVSVVLRAVLVHSFSLQFGVGKSLVSNIQFQKHLPLIHTLLQADRVNNCECAVSFREFLPISRITVTPQV